MTKLVAICAMGEKREIGLKNKIPWHSKSEFDYFKKQTLHHALLMGRNTFLSIGKPLPGRKTLVLSSKEELVHPDVIMVKNLEEALNYCRYIGIEKLFLCGGAQVYNQYLNQCDELLITEIKYNGPADAYFTEIDPKVWIKSGIISKESIEVPNWTAFRYIKT